MSFTILFVALISILVTSVVFIVFGKNNKNKISKAREYLVNNYNELSDKAKGELDNLLK